MSYKEFVNKFAFTVKHLMEAPVGSPERDEWIRIKRELEGMKKATASTVTR
jgi:hypothetical protein